MEAQTDQPNPELTPIHAGITDAHMRIWYYALSWIVAVFICVLAFGASELFPTQYVPPVGVFALSVFQGVSFLLTLLVIGVGIVVGAVLFITQAWHDYGPKAKQV